MKIVVTDGEQRAALAAVRALGRHGHQVTVCAARRTSLAGVSRFASSTHVAPDPCEHPAEFGEFVAATARNIAADVVLPISEAAALAILPLRGHLGGAIVPMPDIGVFRAVADKEHVLRAAAALGISVPEQWVVRSVGSPILGEIPTDRFPLVVKPSRSVVEGPGGRIKLTVQYAGSPDDLRRILAALPPGAYPVLVQRHIVGDGVGVFMLLWDGELWARFAHRRLREKPPTGGVSVYRESIPAPEELFLKSRALLESLSWFGVAMVEYKIDRRTGIAYLMEINGRLWGSLQLAIDSGVDFPTLLLALATGRRPPPVMTYAPMRTRWWWGDIDHLIAVLRAPGTAPRWLTDGRGKLRTAASVLTPLRRGEREEVFRWRDPLPFLLETREWLRGR